MRAVTGAVALALAFPAHAHGVRALSDDVGADAIVAALIAAAALAYVLGTRRLASRRSLQRPRASHDGWWLAAGLVVLAVSLLGPLDSLAARSFAAHMLQHEVLMLVAAPLLVLGRPLARWTWAFSQRGRGRLRRALDVWRSLGVWRVCTSVAGACALQSVALFAWHLPVAFRAALEQPWLHVFQHATFLAVALCFWWTVLRPGPARRVAPPAIASLFFTTLTTGALGALLTFSSVAWYAEPETLPPWGLSATEDQQLGGLIMWIPGGTLYLLVALVLAARALRGGSVSARAVGAG